MGISDLTKKYELHEIVKGDSIFCATGITACDLMNGVIKEYNNYKLNGLVEPEEVKINTNAYKKESDIFMQFMNESIEKEVSSQIFVDDGYFLFREWYKTSGSTAKIPQKKDFIKNLNNKFEFNQESN